MYLIVGNFDVGSWELAAKINSTIVLALKISDIKRQIHVYVLEHAVYSAFTNSSFHRMGGCYCQTNAFHTLYASRGSALLTD